MTGKKTVAIIGLGIGRAHLEEGYATLADRFDVAVLCDLDRKRLDDVGDEFDIARRTTSFAEILAMPDIDIVDICTPPNLHLEHILAALAAGKQVICEKPLVGSLADMDRVAEAERTATGKVMPIFQYRYGDGFQKARRIVALGLAGKPFTATAETAWHRGADYYATQWRGRFATELGGVLLSQAIHLHDMMNELMGDTAEVYARTTTRVNPIEVEDCAVASLRMAGGALVALSSTLGSVNEISRLRAQFEHVTFESCLTPYSPGDDPWQIIPATLDDQAKINAALANWQPVPRRFAGQFAAYHAALTRGGPLPVTLADARRSLELLTALYESAATNRPIALPVSPELPRYQDWRRG